MREGEDKVREISKGREKNGKAKYISEITLYIREDKANHLILP